MTGETLQSDGLEWFREPAPNFRPAVFWFWHRIPERTEIARQLADLREKGVGTVMIQARPALPLDRSLRCNPHKTESFESLEPIFVFKKCPCEYLGNSLQITLFMIPFENGGVCVQ